MKRHLYVLALGLGFFGSVAATAASAGVTADQVVAALFSRGYRHIDVSTTSTQITVHAFQNGVPIELTYDKATGQIVHQAGFAAISGSGSTSGKNSGLSGESEDDSNSNGDDSNSEGSGSHHHRHSHHSDD